MKPKPSRSEPITVVQRLHLIEWRVLPLTNSSRSEGRREVTSTGFWANKRWLSSGSSSRARRIWGKTKGGAIFLERGRNWETLFGGERERELLARCNFKIKLKMATEREDLNQQYRVGFGMRIRVGAYEFPWLFFFINNVSKLNYQALMTMRISIILKEN